MSAPPLALVPVRAGVLPSGGAEAVAEVLTADPQARIVLVGSQLGTAAGDLAGVAPAVELAEVGDFAPGAWAASLAPLARDAAFTVLPGSPDGRDLAARLAAAASLPLLAGALSIASDEVVVAHHGGRLQSSIRPSGPFVATLQPGVRGVEPAAGVDAVTATELVLPDASVPDAVVVEVEPPDAATMDLADAPRIVGGGAGLLRGTDDEVAARVERLTAVGAAIGASAGATRVVTDAGWVPHTRQIGTTGVVVDPRLYLAFAISGAVQHTAGLGHPDHVISVNTDPHCPMMAMADLAIVADANATLDELASLLGAGPLPDHAAEAR